MDIQWALEQLRDFATLTTGLRPGTPGISVTPAEREINSHAAAEAHVIEQILDRVLPEWRTRIPESRLMRWGKHHEAALRAIAQLERQDELQEKLGDNAPTLDAGRMHPWAWEGARSLWQSGHLREAVRAASVKVNAETQNKLGRRDASETDLFRQAYSQDDPKPGQPRLRPPDDDGGRTALGLRRGIMALAEGCYAALRNPASHDVLSELPETEALEQLAAFSLLARFVDRSEVKIA